MYMGVCGPGSVCHLYFDLEFQLVLNQTVDPLMLLETFIQVAQPFSLNAVWVDKKIFGGICPRSTYAAIYGRVSECHATDGESLI